jgi:tRNA threonylcarbamoyladenosine modification (KEOPS) complex Cgi121 subunit
MPAPVPSSEERTVQALGARRKKTGTPSATELITRLRGLNSASPAFVALFDAQAIAGERHLLSAWAHLGRARARQEYRLRDRSAEFALYVAGDDQLPRALSKVGIGPTTEQFVVVVERPRTTAEILEAFGLVEDRSVYPRPPEASTLERLGIGPEERAAVDPGAWEGLVLERVAFVDLAPARAHPTETAKKA